MISKPLYKRYALITEGYSYIIEFKLSDDGLSYNFWNNTGLCNSWVIRIREEDCVKSLWLAPPSYVIEDKLWMSLRLSYPKWDWIKKEKSNLYRWTFRDKDLWRIIRKGYMDLSELLPFFAPQENQNE